MKNRLLLFALLFSLPLCAQNQRVSLSYPSISSLTSTPYLVANVPPNSPVLAVCNVPANGTPCTNYATTFTSGGSACPNGSQDTPDPQPSACQPTGDAQGNIGFFVAPGSYDYTVCVKNNCFGPYRVTILSGGSVTNFSAGNLSPLFTTSVATSTSTPALTFNLSNAPATSVFGNFTGGSAAPGFSATPTLTGLTLAGISGSTQCLHVNSAGLISGTGSDCPNGGGTVTGSGTTNTIPRWTSSSALGNSLITQVADGLGTDVLVSPTGDVGFESIAQPTFACNTANDNPPLSYGCTGSMIEISPRNAANDASSAGLQVQNILGQGPATLSVGIAALLQPTGFNITEQRGIDSEVAAGGSGGTIGTSRGAFISTTVASTGGATTKQQGVYVQTGLTSGVTVTNNSGVFVDSPSITGTGTLTHNYGLFIADQTVTGGAGTNTEPHGITVAGGSGVQTQAVAFATLKTCAAAYEGTISAVTDSSTNTWGATITNGGANHVLAYCNGTNWTVAAK